jgi:SpoVK/Ycf46/Vps4 family AAA+-type ATPase
MDRDGEVPLATLTWSQRTLSTLTLPPSLDTKIRALLSEIAHWEDLDRAGVPRRQRLLLHGPPGCGKTSVASGLARELGVPLATVRVDSIMSSYLGETAGNLRRVFDYAARERVVLLFDEFDAVGKERDDPSDHGELRRVVNAVLQMMEGYVGPSLVVAATNHPGTLDSAVWRRFDEVFEVPMPSVPQLQRVMSRILLGHSDSTVDLRQTAEGLKGLPHAAAEKVAFDARRRALLDGRDLATSVDVKDAVTDAKKRRWS